MTENRNGATTGPEYLELVNSKRKLTLPSGAVFIVRPPNGFWHADHAADLPASLLAKVRPGSEDGQLAEPMNAEEARAQAALRRTMVEDCVLSPKIRKPAKLEEGEIEPEDLTPEDAAFLMDYLYGLIDEHGRSLRKLRHEPEPAASGEGGADVRGAAV